MSFFKSTSKTKPLLSGIILTTLITGAVRSSKSSSSADGSLSRSEQQLNQPLDYQVWRVLAEDRKGFTVVVVSVNPKHFNRADMSTLAKDLNQKFPDKSKLKVGLLDDEKVARLFANGRAEYSTYEASERGRYYLDRTACREYIEFSIQRGKPRQTVKLNCVPQRKNLQE